MDEADWTWLHPLCRRVLLLPRRELALEAEVDISENVQTRVRLTQSGECLADGPCVRLCSTCAYVAPPEGETAVPNTVGKDLEDGNRIRERLEETVEVEGGGELDPLHSDLLVRGRTLRNNSGGDLRLDRAEIIEELISGRR